MEDDSQETTTTTSNEQQSPSTWNVITSVLAAAIGVQTEENRKRDFSTGNPKAYIIAGVLFTFVFIGLLVLIVNLVLI